MSMQNHRKSDNDTFNALPKMGIWATFVFLSTAACVGFRFWMGGDEFLSYFTDDFYYYAEIAKNVATSGRSTFDGITETNGYHPLWLLILTAVWSVTSGGVGFFFIVSLFIVFLTVIFFVQAALWAQDLGATRPVALVSALAATTAMLVVSRTGMETAIALPLALVFARRLAAHPLEEQPPVALVLTGLLTALVVLARLDIVIFVAMTYLASAIYTRRLLLREALLIAVGCMPLWLYLIWNLTTFDHLLPLSGAAKQLKEHWGFSSAPVSRLISIDVVNVVVTFPAALFAIVGTYMTARGRCGLQQQRSGPVLAAAALWPFIYYGALALRSDWGLWTWYLYPFPMLTALFAPFLLNALATRLGSRGRLVRLAPYLAGVVALLVMAGLAAPNPGAVAIIRDARAIQGFAAQHPGIYAMGDRAGAPGFLIESPVIQLEGLVADAAMLDRIRTRMPLKDALREIGADWYVTSKSQMRDDGCIIAQEPANGGPDSPVMEGVFCEDPAESWAFPDGITIYVFDVNRD